MKVVEFLASAQNPLVSVEIIPPRRGANIQKLYQAVESIAPYRPPFIDVTSHSAEVYWEELRDGSFRRVVKRKSPGTFGLCAMIKYRFNIEPVPHLLCTGFTREETEDALIELNYLGVENLLLIRGDAKTETKKHVKEGRSTNNYALDLVRQVADMNRGKYLDDILDANPTDFCMGVSAYPEKHFESPNLNFDLDILLAKQEAGAHYAVSQMFFDNQVYLDYVSRARERGITIPILPGLKIITSKAQLNKLPSAFFLNMPQELVERVLKAPNDSAVVEVGIDWAYQQSIGLLETGANLLHFYIMQNTAPFVRLMERLKKQL
jgi:methylenetetrahydrofolate reductase (NADPH)